MLLNTTFLPNAIITPAQRDNRIEVRVQFVRVIEFPGYTLQLRIRSHRKEHCFLTFK